MDTSNITASEAAALNASGLFWLGTYLTATGHAPEVENTGGDNMALVFPVGDGTAWVLTGDETDCYTAARYRDDAWTSEDSNDPTTLDTDLDTGAVLALLDFHRDGAPFGAKPGHLRLRADGRYEVADRGDADAAHGCTRDDWCILADGHSGDCADGSRESWPGPDTPYPA